MSFPDPRRADGSGHKDGLLYSGSVCVRASVIALRKLKLNLAKVGLRAVDSSVKRSSDQAMIINNRFPSG